MYVCDEEERTNQENFPSSAVTEHGQQDSGVPAQKQQSSAGGTPVVPSSPADLPFPDLDSHDLDSHDPYSHVDVVCVKFKGGETLGISQDLEEEQEYHLPDVTLSAISENSQQDSGIPALNRQSSAGGRPVMPSSPADVPCADLGIDAVLEQPDVSATLVVSHNVKEEQVTLSAFKETRRAKSSIPVLNQQSYTGSKLVITSELADISCADIGIGAVLGKLNAILGTSHRLTASLNSVLEPYIARNDDFGTVYAHLRQYWSYDFARIDNLLRHSEKWIQQKERSTLADGRIRSIQIRCRRVWDLYANRVVPSWATKKTPLGISHAWMDERDRVDVLTRINQRQWPVPMPKDANLDLIRIEMLNLGAEYAWLDVLCLRQQGGIREDLRVPEWKIDVPTIGWVYRNKAVVCYFCGLGRPLRLKPGYFEDDRCWFNRAWTIQEISEKVVIGGETGDDGTLEEDIRVMFHAQLASLRKMRDSHLVFDVLSEMKTRDSTNPLDRIAGLGYILDLNYLPIYDEAQSEEDAWTALVYAMLEYSRENLLFFYPEPGDGSKCWRPSWNQILTKSLPSHQKSLGRWCEDRMVGEDLSTDSYNGYHIDSGYVRGLSHPSHNGMSRQGELDVKDEDTGSTHTFKIIADHTYPIPDGSYTLLSIVAHIPFGIGQEPPNVDALTGRDGRFWVVGRRRQDSKFEKVSVFSMPDDRERGRILDLSIEEYSRIDLC
ncbi:hypothetical protein EV421DRAFT_2082449 [Armillaria borealis]|uniref:Heterokaryon incompatibility domain-containing protein n=1 Tax=Armillaria borealis TaxID=47425 RepID=A0AA39JJG9_9AGAR|nr:hypothetical protein EV421DRAFT_2082449 [Armillaria borealis]